LRVAPSGPDLVLLEDAEELGLEWEGELADLVEEDRAGVASTKQAGPVGARVGEGAALVAEQLALDQAFGDRGEVDADEWAPEARGEL